MQLTKSILFRGLFSTINGFDLDIYMYIYVYIYIILYHIYIFIYVSVKILSESRGILVFSPQATVCFIKQTIPPPFLERSILIRS